MTDEVREEHRTPMGETPSESITAIGRESADLSAQSELEGAKKGVESLNAQLSERDAKMGELQAEIAEKGALIQSQEQELTTLREASAAAEGRSAELASSLTDAIQKYRASLLAANPEVPGEMIGGETIADIDASLQTAKGLVEKVKDSLEAAAAETLVPAGAPQRTGPDLSSLSPAEKIKYAIRKDTA